MPEPPPGYSARQRSGSRRLIIVASRHDLRLRTITRVPSGHLLSVAVSRDAGAFAVATDVARVLGGVAPHLPYSRKVTNTSADASVRVRLPYSRKVTNTSADASVRVRRS